MKPEDVLAALKNADAAGDTAAATKLAQLYASMTQQQAPQVPQGGSIADAAGQGLSFGFADEIAGGLGAGVNSVANLFGAGTGESFGQAYTGIRDAARENADAFAARNPKTALTAELAGGLLTGGAGAARVGALKGAQSLGKLAGVGAAEGGLYGAGASDADTLGGFAKDTATGGLLGGATGALLPALGRSVGGLLSRKGRNLKQLGAPVGDDLKQTFETGFGQTPGRMTDEGIEQTAAATARGSLRSGNRYADDVQLLRDNGIELTTGQRTGSTGVKAFETTIDKTLWGGAVDKTFAKQRQQLQTKLMKMAGFPEEVAQTGLVTDDALEAAGKQLSKEYTAALAGKTVTLGDDFIDALADIEKKHSRLLTPQQRREVKVLIDDFLNEAIDGDLTGKRYQKLRSFVGERARKQKNSNPIISDLFNDMKNALDDSFVQATGGSNKALNTKYAQFKQIETLFQRGGGTKMAQGELPLASLNSLAKKSPGSKEWRKLVNAASAVLGDATPNSGTASRLANLSGTQKMGDLVTGGVPTFILNQALARGVGGGAPQMVGGLLSSAGRGVQQAGNFAGATGGAAGVSAIPGLLSQQPQMPPVDPWAQR